MAGDNERSNFWTTLPGILTGVAALVTASGGIVLGLHQFRESNPAQGRVDTVPQSASAASVPKQETPTSQPQSVGSTPSRSPSLRAAPQLQSSQGPDQPASGDSIPTQAVRITKTDGSVLWSFVDKFISVTPNFEFDSGQLIGWDKIKTLDVLSGDDGKWEVRVTLTDGRVIVGSSHYNLYVRGNNDIGEIDVEARQVKEISFSRWRKRDAGLKGRVKGQSTPFP
jgi:hypothetical protein